MNTSSRASLPERLALDTREASRLAMRVALVAVLAYALVAILSASGANAADAYTLDGKSAAEQDALKGGLNGGCSVAPSPAGTYDCFSSIDKRDAAVSSAIGKGKVPPGSTAMPPKAALVAIAKKKTKHVAHASACNSLTNMHVDTYMHNTWGYMDYVPNWLTFNSTFNNTISSQTTSNYYLATYHDGNGGTGHYFSQSAVQCHIDNDLGSDPFPTGGSWNNKFSSGLNN